MRWREANEDDLDLLARMNLELIEDEGHQNPMNIKELKGRMREWLSGQYTAVIFEDNELPVAYALFRPVSDDWEVTGIYMRQFYVERRSRQQGIGRKAMDILKQEIWPKNARITLGTLVHNQRAQEFFKSLGFREYCVTYEYRND